MELRFWPDPRLIVSRKSTTLGLWLSVAAFLMHAALAAPHFEAVEIPGKILAGNPLSDPVERRAAVFTPTFAGPTSNLITVYYLPGYGGCSEDFLGSKGAGFVRMIQGLADKGIPLRMVIPDCRNRWGGSQYLNSMAQGNYADYVLEEIVPHFETFNGQRAASGRRIIAGHSSGGFGALRLAMLAKDRFSAVVALSPDLDFEVTHKKFALNHLVKSVSPSQMRDYLAPPDSMIAPGSSLVQMMLGLSAAYAPRLTGELKTFEWLYDEQGRWREEVWQRWLEADPVVIARRNHGIFKPSHKVYLDGAERDEFEAQKGARTLWGLIREHTNANFFESPGGHSDFIEERLARGLEWVFDKQLRPIADR